jgi:PAS domain S-box-containing protein
VSAPAAHSSASILLVEDNLNDAEILQIELEAAGLQLEVFRVDTEAAFLNALARPFDLIISDYTLPAFSGKAALRIARERRPDIPFIFVSGTIGEDAAIDSLVGGATDYVLKHKATRLVPAVKRALRESEERRLRESAEAMVRQSEEDYRLLFEELAVPILITSPDGKVLNVNSACAHLLGCRDKEEVLQLDIAREVYVEPGKAVALQKAVEEQGHIENVEVKLSRKGGATLIVLATVTPQRKASTGIVAYRTVWRDITEQRRVEAQFRQSQKMEAIGRLAGGIAHDFNNILTVISGYSEMALAQRLDRDLNSKIECIRDASIRAANLTRQLLAFSRKQHLQMQVLDLNTLIKQIEMLIRRIVGEDIELVSHLDPDLLPVKADPGQLEQVLMNLVVNARDAMPDGGKLTITTRNVHLNSSFFGDQFAVSRGDYAMLSVEDTGCGMDERTQAQIFEPFFTTKESGKGTGLGLSTVYGIIKQSDGHVWVQSKVGAGSTFSVYLPTTADPLSGRAGMPDAGALSVGGTETILLVEDEDSVRELTAIILRHVGYTVLEARNGLEAIERAKHYADSIHVLLTDMVMPNMSGPTAAAEIGRSRPTLRVLFMSGYPEPAQVANVRSDIELIHKPFAPNDLLRRVRAALDYPTEVYTEAGGTVLVVEDDEALLSLLAAALKHAGLRVFTATNALNAHRILAQEKCDLVVTDVVMPYKDGIDFAVELLRGKAPPKIVLISGVPDALTYVEGSDIFEGVVTIAKPFKVDILIARVNQLLGRSRSS